LRTFGDSDDDDGDDDDDDDDKQHKTEGTNNKDLYCNI